MSEPVLLFGIPYDFILFALTLLGVALFHRQTLPIALAGLGIITAYKLTFTGFKDGVGFAGLGFHLSHEFSLLTNLFLLLTGFALLSRHFEESGIPDEMPTLLPGGWKGGVVGKVPTAWNDTTFMGQSRGYHDMYMGYDPVTHQDRCRREPRPAERYGYQCERFDPAFSPNLLWRP